MFYGGRLLNHLTADDPDVEDFISLRRLNRNLGIVVDSDKTGPRKRIGATKQRVREEFRDGSGLAWVTKGYTIENYVPPEVLAKAVTARRPGTDLQWDGDPYVNPLSSLIRAGREIAPDKIAIAREVVQLWDQDTIWPLDLRSQVDQCVHLIRSANGLGSVVS